MSTDFTVMGGALAAFLPLQRLVVRRRGPVYAARFALPTRRALDASLILGAALFGIGWGLGGFCPGPAWTSVGAAAPKALIFTAAMIAGFGLHRLQQRHGERRASSSEAELDPSRG